MDFQRLFLFLIFSFSLMMVWDGWQRYQNPPVVQQAATTKSDLPVATTKPTDLAAQAAIIQQAAKVETGKIIKVKTDFLEAEINSVGGDIQRLDFIKHLDGQDKTKQFVLFEKGSGTHNYIAQSGLLGTGMPNHTTVFSAEQDSYQLTGDKLEVKLAAVAANGMKVVKLLTFHKSSYVVDVAYEIENTTAAPITTSAYFQLIRDSIDPAGGSKMVPTYTGMAVYTDKEKFQKIAFSDVEKGKIDYPKEGDNGWIGILQHYFVAAWLPKDKTSREFFTRKLEGDAYSAGVIVPVAAIAPGQKAVVSMPLYAGPAQSTLDSIAPGLGLTVDYGWLTVVATPIFWTLTFIQGMVQNWGVAIILLTVLIKLLFFPLSAASYRSMAKMRVVAPKLEKIKLQHADDREKLNRAMMDLYKTEKINPLGGCLPVLIQIPVFIALYWSILASVEMRNAPFFGWITDLSAADPFFVLPVLMGASMFLQSKLNPVPPDPIQAKIMKIMPIAFSVVFFWFPAGLVLYSIVNNALSIAQQWYITRSIEVAGAAKR
ncbi:membrane protein insertase YidC [Gallionella capsiferriformans]|jgi:YidC/Oxa1 family membrane protein insertase|uniref:Membrane protein insertase YidC n=1 Tax=Gallionella capsiferriformans (strain ES-2) TaxID=395494 RepID=D9SEP3_GALCS|nr:membrane protein insertase YidC [Gallionella capsiferriformans]ADL56938.1 membrane protein insertase, YidC/Oxa1 family domain containing [Gallionella capsiferriformans ES-2]